MGILPLTDVFGKMAEQDGGLRVAVVGLALGRFAELFSTCEQIGEGIRPLFQPGREYFLRSQLSSSIGSSLPARRSVAEFLRV